MQSLSILTFLIILFASCSSKETSHDEQLDSNEAIDTVEDQSSRIIMSDSTINLTFLREDVIISSKNFTTDYPSSETDTTMCTDWTLSEEQIRLIISHSTHLDPSDWHYFYEHLPCSIEVVIVSNGDTLDLEINGGSFLFLRLDDKSILLSDTLQEHEAFFLSSPITIDEME